ncbi:MAG: RNA polymerase sigma factor [Dehalococcoidia bacterium]
MTAVALELSTRGRIDEAIDRHYGEILALARRTVGPTHADDIAQEAFIRAARSLWRLDSGANVRAWIYKIALNCCRDHFRRNKRETELSDGLASRTNGPEVTAEQQELLREVRVFLLELPRRQREAFLLRRLQGLEYTEIAAVMDCSQDTARANVYQAFKKLRAHFSGHVEGKIWTAASRPKN